MRKMGCCIVLMCSGYVNASGFKMDVINPSSFGLANAGSAADVSDASIAFHNVAGMHALGKESFISSLSVIDPNSRMDNTQLSGVGLSPSVNTTVSDATQAFVGGALLPSLFYVRPLNHKMTGGVSITVPFGVDFSYHLNNGVERLVSETHLRVLDVQPALSYQWSNHWMVGMGLNMMYATERLSREAPVFGTRIDYEGSDTAVGFNLGFLASFNENRTRVGGKYQSEVGFDFKGTASVQGANPAIPELSLYNDVHMPSYIHLGLSHQFKNQWSTHVGVMHTRWPESVGSRLSTQIPIHILNMPSGVDALFNNQFPNWHNTLSMNVGVRYQVTPTWQLRFGYLWDDDPAEQTSEMAPSLLSALRTQSWVTVGAGYNPSGPWAWDVMCGVMRASKSEVGESFFNPMTPNQNITLKGNASTRAYTYGVQVTYDYE